jgi:hypothetical protein
MTRLRDHEESQPCEVCGATALSKLRTKDGVPYEKGMTLYSVEYDCDQERWAIETHLLTRVLVGWSTSYIGEPTVTTVMVDNRISELYGHRSNAAKELLVCLNKDLIDQRKEVERLVDEIADLRREIGDV